VAKTILTDAFVVVNGVNLSDHGSHVEVTSDKDEVEVTGFGATSKVILLGLGDGNMNFTFQQDFAVGSVDQTLQPIHANATSVLVEVRPTSAARSATNPAYTMTGVLSSYSPLNGDVGDASTIDATFRNSSQTGIQRLTA
jgi:hypothetical protein